MHILGWRQFLKAAVLYYHECAKHGSWNSFAQHLRGSWLQLLNISHSHGVPTVSEQTLLFSPRFSLCLSSTWPVRLVTGPVEMVPVGSLSLASFLWRWCLWGSLSLVSLFPLPFLLGSFGFCLGFCLSFMDGSQGPRTMFGLQQPLLKNY